MKSKIARLGGIILVSLTASLLILTPVFAAAAFITPLTKLSFIAFTAPANGDINPYGVALITQTHGMMIKGHVLISNFNNSMNQQGTGTTIDEIAPDGTVDLFSQINPANLPGPCPGGIGLTTALVALRSGWVIVGSLPTSDGTAATAQSGCLLVLNSMGKVVETITGDGINGPWDMTAVQEGDNHAVLFVTNVLNGTVAASPNVVNEGTVVRLRLKLPEHKGLPKVTGHTVIGSGFSERTDINALVIGPTGVGLSEDGTLYIADTLSNRVAVITNALNRMKSAGTGTTLSQGGAINGPLGLAVAPDGDVLVVNGGDGNLVDITQKGVQAATMTITPGGGGALFGLAIVSNPAGVYFVDDSNNSLNLLH